MNYGKVEEPSSSRSRRKSTARFAATSAILTVILSRSDRAPTPRKADARPGLEVRPQSGIIQYNILRVGGDMRLLAFVLLAPALFAQDPSPDQIRSAAARAVALLQKGVTGFYKTQDCFSC